MDNKLTSLGKLFFVSAMGWTTGKKLNFKLRGDPKKLQALADAIIASKKFQDELKNPKSTVSSVLKKLEIKNEAIKKFETEVGIPFPL